MTSIDRADPTKAFGAALDTGPLRRALVWCLALLALTSVTFVAAPWIDIAVSSLFYTPGRGFQLGGSTLVVTLRNFGIFLTWVVCLGSAALALWWWLRPADTMRWPGARPWADWMFVTAAMALGPGVLVNLIFKPVWGRARPRQVTEFGGKWQFTGAWVPSGQCDWGCSFVSGEAAASAILLALVFVVPRAWRLATLAFAVVVTLLVSFARVAAGGHYLSDVVIAWLLMVLVLLVLHAQIYHGAWLGPLRRWFPSL